MNSLFGFILLIIFQTVSLSDWNYLDKGPDYWPSEFETCKETEQSPINIDTASIKYKKKLKYINFYNYDIEYTWNFTNDGHNIIISRGFDVDKTRIPQISGSDFSQSFYLEKFHFHWGYNIYQGSEHSIDDEKSPLELQMVHRSDSGTVAIVSFLFEIDQNDNQALKVLLETINENIPEDSFKLQPMVVKSILPDIASANKDGYYRYSGSYTTPPCSQGVIWTVFKRKIKISEDQMNNFYVVDIRANFRNPQKLNDRKVYFSGVTKEQSSIYLNFILFTLILRIIY